jgi:hypothetical protein
VQGDLNAGFEGCVESLGAVAGQDHDTGVVFERSEEDWDSIRGAAVKLG